jgi:hypothetical protein
MENLISGIRFSGLPRAIIRRNTSLSLFCATACVKSPPQTSAPRAVRLNMTSEAFVSPASPAYSDAEKGLLDSLPVQLSYLPTDRKDARALTTKTKKAPAPAVKTKKPKKRVSNWILWKIWFNTYRWVVFFIVVDNAQPSSIMQEVLHIRVQYEHDWHWSRDLRTFSLCR